MSKLKLNSRDWKITPLAHPPASRRGAAAPISTFPPEFLTDESQVVEEFSAQPSLPARRGPGPTGPLDLSYDLADGESAVLAVRHPSGALTFHLPVEATRREAAPSSRVRFVVDVRSTHVETGRRGLVSAAVKAVIVKVAKAAGDRLVSTSLSALAKLFEQESWKRRGLHEGWMKVTRDSLVSGKLHPETPSVTDRALLFLHGTFSNSVSAYGSLAQDGPDFFDRLAALYSDRIYAFDHFTVSRTPEENARMLLDALPAKTFTFDVITHSRGGLVLRNLVERSTVFPNARRFRLGRAVLVASPNEGTPLATPARWQETVGWIANLLELFPENPFTTGAEFVANGIVWLARHASGDLPGIHSMDSAGEPIAAIQGPPGPPADAYSALVANYNPTANVLQRLIDTGVDQFFRSANDLVVPSEGGWHIDHTGSAFIPASRIGCFGPGGNLSPDSVTHISFFSHRETVDFLINALRGEPQPLAAIDPTRPLPNRRWIRAAGVESTAIAPPAAPAIAPQAPLSSGARTALSAEGDRLLVDGSQLAGSDLFNVLVLSPEKGRDYCQVLAHYGSARVIETLHLRGRGSDARAHWQTIDEYHGRIKAYANESKGSMPNETEMSQFGEALFKMLMPGKVCRLYDTARSLQRGERLNVIFTSDIDWVADVPWEFACDPVRKTALATEDLHFIRNVMTAVPAEVIDDRQQLRILVASAQPVGSGRLSVDEEEKVIRRGFVPLIEAGLADVKVLPRATPATIHGHLSTGRYTVVHFIGHGYYDQETDRGYLLFEDDYRQPYQLDSHSAREIFCNRGLRAVFLNACQTGKGGEANFNSGVAQSLVRGGVPIVVANQYSVLDVSATFFAQHFYWSLAHGLSVGQAAREARIAVNYSLSGEAIDWAVPVVYARDPNSRLSPPRLYDSRSMSSPVTRPSARRGVAGHRVRVAVWDTHSQFPELQKPLDRMNAAQDYFGFEIVDLSVPMDAWHIKRGRRYLNAERFAATLAPQFPQLGVQFLSVILKEPLVCDLDSSKPDYDIYEWWPSPPKPPVLLLSTHTLDLSPTGPETERAIANAAVTGITGYRMDVDSHERPPLTCPNHYNAELKDHQKFCKKCWHKFHERFPAESEALKSLLEI